jgi:predicted RNase H-like HicB family nuclease
MTAGVEPRDTNVRLSYEEGYGYSARHVPSGIASQGDTEEEALRALAEALTLHRRDDEDAIEAGADWYERFGVAPRPDISEPLPDFLQ